MTPSVLSPRERVSILRWALPLAFASLAVTYELTLARWVHNNYGDAWHFTVEALFFATAGPLLAFWALTRIGHWLDEKEQVEKQARTSEHRLASITSASADAILGIDASGHIELWNRGAELLFKYPAASIIGQPLSILFEGASAADVELSWLYQQVHKDGFVQSHETVCRDAEHQALIVELTATSLVDDSGGQSGMSIILRDITNRKRREEEIKRLNESLHIQVADRTSELAQKVAQLGLANSELQKLDQMRSEFVSLVSHQLRAPLTNMRGAVEQMDASCAKVNNTCARMFIILSEQMFRLESLVKDVLNAARLESGELVVHAEPASLLPVVKQVVEQMQARMSGRVYQLPIKPGLPLIYADRDRVAEVLANLLDNADKYSPQDQPISIGVSANQIEVTLSIRDAGPGLPPEDLERVFEKFYRTDSSDSQSTYGYGLGLYVCRMIIELQGGRIWAENHPQGGAVFSFTLPAWKGENEQVENLAGGR